MGKRSTFLITDINFVNGSAAYTIIDVNDGIEFKLTEIKEYTDKDFVSGWLKSILTDNIVNTQQITYKNALKKMPLKFDGVITGALKTVEDLKPIPNRELRMHMNIYRSLNSIEKAINEIVGENRY